MSKKRVILLIIFVFALALVLLLLLRNNRQKPIESLSSIKLEKIRYILESSGYFDNSKYDYNEDEMKVIIDDTYEIYVKNSYYLMNIKNDKQENIYCKIVDAISMSFNNTKGSSLNTCELSLSGQIHMSGIDVEFYENNKILTIDSDNMFTIYNPNNTHTFNELIPLEEVNYAIKDDEFLLTNINFKFKEDSLLSICGNIYSKRQKSTLVFTVYSGTTEKLGTSLYEYNNDNKRNKEFCVTFEKEQLLSKYYSVTTT